MFRAGNRHNDEERQEVSEDVSPPGGAVAQPQHEEIGMTNRNDPSQSLEGLRGHDFDNGADNLWSLYGKEALVYDESRINTLKGDMESIIIFAGLFSAVLTAFLVLKIQDLKPDPTDRSAYYQNQTVHILDHISRQLASTGDNISTNSNPPLPYYSTFRALASDRRANIAWLLSLIFSLFAVFLATLVQQWSKDYMHIFQQADNPLQIARFRVSLFEGSKRLPVLAEVVHGLIHFSLILFFWGLGEIILQIDTAIFFIILAPITICVCLYLYCTVAPILDHGSPYRTPFSWFVIQISPRYNDIKSTSIEKLQATKSRMKRYVHAIQWLVNRTNGSDEMQALVLAIPGSFNGEWGRQVWRGVVKDRSTSTQARSDPGSSSTREGTTVYELCKRVQYYFETYKDEGNFTNAGIGSTRRMRGYVETAAFLVCCTGVELGLFGDVGEVLSEVGDKEQTNTSLTIGSNPLFVVRWTCLSLVAIKHIINNNHVQEIAKFALNGIAPFQTNMDRRQTVEMALTAVKKMVDDRKKAWDAVLDLRLALEPWSQIQNQTKIEIRDTLRLNNHEVSIQELEHIASEAVGVGDFDWRIHLLQERMDKLTHRLTQRLPGVFFHELPSTVPNTTSEAFNPLSVQTSPIPPQLIFPGRQLQSIYILGQKLRDITRSEDTEWDEESLKSLKYLREVSIPSSGFNLLMERQIWRLLDLRDGGGLGFTIELFFLALRQLSSASPSLDESSSSESKKMFYVGTFDVITSDWERCKDSAGTQRILLDILGDLVIKGRGIFSDFPYPRYIVEMLLDLVGKIVKGLGRGSNPHIDNLLYELVDVSGTLRNRMNFGLRDEVLRTIYRSLGPVTVS